MYDRNKMIARIKEIQKELQNLGVTDIEFFEFTSMSDEGILEEGLALRDQLERKKKSYEPPKKRS